MNKRIDFLNTVSGGRETLFYKFLEELVESVESGSYSNIAGPGYLIKMFDGKIEASALIRSEHKFKDYSWEVSV